MAGRVLVRGSRRNLSAVGVHVADRGERRLDRETKSGELCVRPGLRGASTSDLAFLGQMVWLSALGRAHDPTKSEARRRR